MSSQSSSLITLPLPKSLILLFSAKSLSQNPLFFFSQPNLSPSIQFGIPFQTQPHLLPSLHLRQRFSITDPRSAPLLLVT
ncbi:hypothetical protein PRUPE_4G203200 [Prunus persica]|uniref:Uncharacterized protein n=1 Tax=Prunus persica TaxID=3760 RepID=A0A251PNF3_PRUPE|nr:hypothetical protein PRUPE_4G203200 [Prunus persica]